MVWYRRKQRDKEAHHDLMHCLLVYGVAAVAGVRLTVEDSDISTAL